MNDTNKRLDTSSVKSCRTVSKGSQGFARHEQTSSIEKSIQLAAKLDIFESVLDSYIEQRNHEYQRLSERLSQNELQTLSRNAERRSSINKRLKEFEAAQALINSICSQEHEKESALRKKLNESLLTEETGIRGLMETHKSGSEKDAKAYAREFDKAFGGIHIATGALKESKLELDDNIRQQGKKFFEYADGQLASQHGALVLDHQTFWESLQTVTATAEDYLRKEQQTRRQAVEELLTLLDSTCRQLETAVSQ